MVRIIILLIKNINTRYLEEKVDFRALCLVFLTGQTIVQNVPYAIYNITAYTIVVFVYVWKA